MNNFRKRNPILNVILMLVGLALLLVGIIYFANLYRHNHYVKPTPPITAPTPLPGINPSPGSIKDRIEHPGQPHEEITGDAEVGFDADGNNIAEMKIGDMGIYSAKATLTKIYPKNTDVAAMLQYARRYMGTRYEYGSNRATDTTFDCSDYTQWVYRSLGMQLPKDSRTQQMYVKQFGTHRWADWHRASPGDLFFFTNYRGSGAGNYTDVTKESVVSHVGIYLGNGEVLHTASNPTGVRIQKIAGTHLEWRLVSVGRPY